MTAAWRGVHRLAVAFLATVVALGSCTTSPVVSGGSQSPTVTVAAPSVPTRSGEYRPSGGAALADEPDYYRDGCRFTADVDTPPPAGRCVYGDPSGLPVAIVGDSKIGQWMPALQRIAEVEHWRLLFYSRSSCPFATEADQANCSRFVERVFTQLRDEEKPKLIFSSHISRTDPVIRSESALLTQLHTAIGTRAVLLADTPQRGTSSMFDCLRAATDYVADCSFRKNDGSGTPALRAIAQQVPDAVFVTMNDVVCPTTATCPPVLDHILLYRAGSHLTKTFINALAPTLHLRLIEAGVAKRPVITAS